MSRRTIVILVGALVLLLAVAPFIPRGDDEDGGLVPSGKREQAALRPATTAGPSKVTPQMQAEIERVVAQGEAASRTLGRTAAKATPEQLAADLVRCAELEGQRYCLGVGWTEDSPEEVQARVASSARATAAGPENATENTGDLDARALLAREARLSPEARAAADRAELTRAARAVAKVWLLRHDIEGVPLPAGFLQDHPEARATTTSTSTARTTTETPSEIKLSRTKTRADYPRRDTVLDPKQVSEQHRTYWCGPTTMQMIVWGWKGAAQRQQRWANHLHTTTGGTAISDMVRVVNRSTGWDRAGRAGKYIVLDIGRYDFAKWELLMMRHIHDYRAPVVLHPILHKAYYPYLDDDASGHFQVGRGYNKRGGHPDLLGYFEPWNQQRFDPSEPYIARVQWRLAYKSFRANKAHFQHNVGV